MSTELEVTILGCGSSGGVPRIGNEWGNCDPENPKNDRRRCSILIRRISDAGETTVLVDTGPDMRRQVLDENVQHLDGVVYTHAHADHLHGIDDLRTFAQTSRAMVEVYMDAFTSKRAHDAFGYVFSTPKGSSYPPILNDNRITAGTPFTVTGKGGAIEFLPIEVQHGDIHSLAYRFNDVVYLPDVSDIPEASVENFAGLKLWILDCLRRGRHPSHFSVEDCLNWMGRMKPERGILTNLNNDLDYETLKAEVPESLTPAYDGLKVRLPL